MFNQPDTTLGSRMYLDCIKAGLVLDYYYLRADTLLLKSGQAEQFKSFVEEEGGWLFSNSRVTFRKKNSSDRVYHKVIIEDLIYLIPSKDNAEIFSDSIKKCLSAKRQELNLKTSKQTAQRIEFVLSKSCICGLDVLVEVPQESQIFEDRKWQFDSYKPRKSSGEK